MATLWTKEDEDLLKQFIEDGKDLDFLSDYFSRTKIAIELKARKMDLVILRGCRNWREDEIVNFTNDWQDYTFSVNKLVKKYKRSYTALKIKACRLDLGARPSSEEYLTIRTICFEMNVSRDRVHHWIKLGLKTKRNKSGKGKYLIDSADLLSFLHKHPSIYNASDISIHLFAVEPKWLKDKRREDLGSVGINNGCVYTNENDKLIINQTGVF
jgi:hypothetical protein